MVGRAGRNNVLLGTNWFSFGSFEIQIDNSEQQAEFNHKTLRIRIWIICIVTEPNERWDFISGSLIFLFKQLRVCPNKISEEIPGQATLYIAAQGGDNRWWGLRFTSRSQSCRIVFPPCSSSCSAEVRGTGSRRDTPRARSSPTAASRTCPGWAPRSPHTGRTWCCCCWPHSSLSSPEPTPSPPPRTASPAPGRTRTPPSWPREQRESPAT